MWHYKSVLVDLTSSMNIKFSEPRDILGSGVVVSRTLCVFLALYPLLLVSFGCPVLSQRYYYVWHIQYSSASFLFPSSLRGLPIWPDLAILCYKVETIHMSRLKAHIIRYSLPLSLCVIPYLADVAVPSALLMLLFVRHNTVCLVHIFGTTKSTHQRPFTTRPSFDRYAAFHRGSRHDLPGTPAPGLLYLADLW